MTDSQEPEAAPSLYEMVADLRATKREEIDLWGEQMDLDAVRRAEDQAGYTASMILAHVAIGIALVALVRNEPDLGFWMPAVPLVLSVTGAVVLVWELCILRRRRREWLARRDHRAER